MKYASFFFLIFASVANAQFSETPKIGTSFTAVKTQLLKGQICRAEDHDKINDKTLLIYCFVAADALDKPAANDGVLDTIYIGENKVLGIKYLFPAKQFQKIYNQALKVYGPPVEKLSEKGIDYISKGLPGEIATYFNIKNRRVILRLVKDKNFFATEVLQFATGTKDQPRVDKMSKIISKPDFI